VVRKYYIRFDNRALGLVSLPRPVINERILARCRAPSPFLASTSHRLLSDVLTLIRLALRRARLAAENLFLRKQLALYHERGVKPGRPDSETRAILVLL
jgi:hypothetical protein